MTQSPLSFIALAATLFAAPALAQTAPPPAFATCKVCHSVEKGGKNGIGPNLSGIVNSPAASKPDYVYSPAMKAVKIRWTRAELEAFITAPTKRVPGTKMAAPPIMDPVKRKAVLDYLASLK